MEKYWIVFTGCNEIFYDRSGPAFVMLIKLKDDYLNIDALGVHSIGKNPAFGRVPGDTYKEFLIESMKDSYVMLRLQIDSIQYSDCLAIIQNWNRRVTENALLYDYVAMNNILFIKQITEVLNKKTAFLHLYNLDWGLKDSISEHNPPAHTPFLYFKELRRLNNNIHIKDEQFQPYLSLIKETQ